MRGSSSWADEAEREDAERKEEDHQKKKEINPFGDAKPREVVLAEKGVDWRKKDMELQRLSVSRKESWSCGYGLGGTHLRGLAYDLLFGSFCSNSQQGYCNQFRPDSEEEKKLREEIRALEEVVKSTVGNDCRKGGDRQTADAEHRENLKAQLVEKENELQQLTFNLNDKIRFSQRLVDRPPFRSGYLHSVTGPDARKRNFLLDPLDLSGNCGPEMPGTSQSHGGMFSISEGEWLPGVTSRIGNFTQGLESERQGSFSGRGNTPRSQNSRSCKLVSHLEHGELAQHCDAGRLGTRSGNGNSFQRNGQKRPGSRSGYSDVIRTGSEKMGSFSGNSDQGYYSENLGLGSSLHSDVPKCESGRQTYRSGGSGYDSDRHSFRSEQEYDVKGYDFEISGIHGGYGRRDFLRPCDTECPDSLCGHVEAEMCGAFHEGYYSTSGKRNPERSVSIFDSGRLGPLPPGQSDIGRGHQPLYRQSSRRASGQDRESSRREYHVVQGCDGRGRQQNGMQQDNRRGREYRGIQQYDRRQVSS